MRVTLVHPAGFNFVPGQPDFSVLANRMPPIGIMQLASWLERFGHSVHLHDCLGPHAPPTIAENAEISAPLLVGSLVVMSVVFYQTFWGRRAVAAPQIEAQLS